MCIAELLTKAALFLGSTACCFEIPKIGDLQCPLDMIGLWKN